MTSLDMAHNMRTAIARLRALWEWYDAIPPIRRIHAQLARIRDGWRRLSRWLNSVMPKGLYARALLIIILPMVILQSVIAFVFMERHWNVVTQRLSAGVVQDIAALIDVYRPGVMERLGLGPDVVQAANPRLVYGRMTGWGQTGPLAHAAGHDINYIAITGALHAIGTPDTPVPPLNLVGDYGGGGMYLAFGLVCAILEARGSGLGQVVDAAMVDGATALMTPIYQAMANGRWQDRRGSNFLDSGAPWYDTYETKDGRHIAIGAIEPQFYALLLDRLGLSAASLPPQNDPSGWPVLRARFAETFLTRDRDAWVALLEGTDACFAPVLSMQEAASHPHLAARGVFIEVDGIAQPGPAPRFSRTAATVRGPAPEIGADGSAILAAAGFSQTEIDAAISTG